MRIGRQLFATKPVSRIIGAAQGELQRTLSVTALTLLGVGGIIGTGIFVLTGTAAATHAGPALVLSFIVAGIGSAFAGLCYAEFAAMIPVAGSAYSYCYATLGEGVAWFIGWNLILEYLFAAATLSVGWSGYVLSLLDKFSIRLPYGLTHAPFAQASAGGFELVRTCAILNVPAILLVGAIGTVCYIGIRQSSQLNTVVVAIKVAVIVSFIFLGLGHIHPATWRPFIPPNAGRFGVYGWSGILAGSGVIFFAYIGFDAISTTAQEAKRPQRDLPIGILTSLGISTLLYVAVAAVLTAMVSYRKLNVAAPIALALDASPSLRWLGLPVDIGAIAGMTSVLLMMILAQARIFFSMAQDGLLPRIFGRVHPEFHTPSFGTVLTAVCAAVIGGLFPVALLGELVSIGTLLAFVTVCVGVLVLRYRRPDLPRPFRVPWPWFTCTGGALVCTVMMIALPASTWLRLIGWTIIGAVIYACYGYPHSKMRAAVPAGAMAPAKAYSDIPGTVIFDLDRAQQGYHLNQFCMSLMKPENRVRFLHDPRAFLDEWPMSEDQKRAVLARDYNRMIALGGNIYFLSKIFSTDGKSFQHAAALMTGMTPDAYVAMMLAGGRSPDGNPRVAEAAVAEAQ
jgi:APA family basic amino acid/polyamine antiporter